MDSLPQGKNKLKVFFQANTLKLKFPLPTPLKHSFPLPTTVAFLFVS